MTLKPKPPTEKQRSGAQGEAAALARLETAGLQLVTRNYRCRSGELDLVMQRGATLVVIEVRRRARQDFGGALASVNAAKQARIINATRHFLVTHPRYANCQVRFDVVGIETDGRLEWVQAAFDATGYV
ncbi:MAG: YraN family protein [Nevskiales bacterium]